VKDDPLEALVARSMGASVSDVRAETLEPEAHIERKRLHFTTDAGATAVLFERSARGAVLEAQLLPFLARKTAHVPRVHSRGIPPPNAPLGPWLLLEDLTEEPSACDDDPLDLIRAKVAIERAVANDGPALRALGIPSRAWPELAKWPISLVHGQLTCEHARRVERGVVLTRWSAAYLGCGLLDAVRLASRLRESGRDADAEAAVDLYVKESGGPADRAMLREAERVDALFRAGRER
jgi:hypothetical protein